MAAVTNHNARRLFALGDDCVPGSGHGETQDVETRSDVANAPRCKNFDRFHAVTPPASTAGVARRSSPGSGAIHLGPGWSCLVWCHAHHSETVAVAGADAALSGNSPAGRGGHRAGRLPLTYSAHECPQPGHLR